MGKSKEEYYRRKSNIVNWYADDYIKELEEENEEMLECIIKLYKNLKAFGSNISKANAAEIIEKATGKSIKEVLIDE